MGLTHEHYQLHRSLGDLVHHWHGRVHDQTQRHRGFHVRRTHAERHQPRAGCVLEDARCVGRPGCRLLRDGGGGSGGRCWAGDHRDHLPYPPFGVSRRRESAEVLRIAMLPLEIVTPVPATGFFTLAWLLIAIPAASAAVLLLVGRRADRWAPYLGAAAPLVSFAIGLVYFVQLLGRAVPERAVSVPLYNWIASGRWQIDVGLLIDQLSIVFVLLITGVGGLIHVYSIGYMAHDARRRRFFAFLNLFVAAMLLLVLADNYLVLFVGWEGVGLASFLLIGFWQYKPVAATAAKKAFVVNRVGDMGMSIAIMLMLATFGSSAFVAVNEGMPSVTNTTALIMGLLLLLGACGKSAQVPLQSWLLDAMEGPTPVSALIHAATMVTAGVYLIVRSNFIFELAPHAQTVVVIVAVVTLLWGAVIGCAKDDIKKALAGSTMSQIGYMMLGAGLGVVGYP